MMKKSRATQGIGFSVEAMLAAFVIFGVMLYATTFAGISSQKHTVQASLNEYASGVAAVLAKTGSIQGAVSPVFKNDSSCRSIIDGYGGGICLRAEAYRNGIEPSNLTYVYVSSNCTGEIPQQRGVAIRPFAVWLNSTTQDYYVARVTAWPRGG